MSPGEPDNDGTLDHLLGRAQFWLQGFPNRRRPWLLVRVGNAISDLRYWAWRRSGRPL